MFKLELCRVSSCGCKFGPASRWCSCSCTSLCHRHLDLAHVSQNDARIAGLGCAYSQQTMVGRSTDIQQLRDQMYCFVNCFYMCSIKNINTAAYHHSQFPAGFSQEPSLQQPQLLTHTRQSLHWQTGQIQSLAVKPQR